MGGRFGGDNVTVVLPGGCQCPSGPHRQDEVYLLPRLTFDGGAAAEAVITRHLASSPVDEEALSRDLCAAYIRHQAIGWNLVDESGAPAPFSVDLLLSDWTTARVVADKADDLYSAGLLAPLVEAASPSSPRSRTAASTSPRTRPASRARKR
jgi:hypothetical protein